MMSPTTNDEREQYVDLINRSLFYYCLDDKYIQEELCDIKDPNVTLKLFFDNACVAEQKRKSFQDIGATSSSLDSTSGISMSKFESKFERHKRFDSPQQGGGGANSGNRPLNGASKKAFVPAKTVSATSNAATGAVQKSKKPLICY